MDNDSVAEKIKSAREKAGLTQAQLAEKVGTTSQNISQYERGIRNPKYNTLEKIARSLGVDVEYFHKNLFDISAPDPRDAFVWIEYPEGTLEVSYSEMQELDALTDDFLIFELERFKQRKIEKFIPNKK